MPILAPEAHIEKLSMIYIPCPSLITKNSFPRYVPGATTQGHSSVKVTGGGGRTPRFLPWAVQLIKLLPTATTKSKCQNPRVEVRPLSRPYRWDMRPNFQLPRVDKCEM